MTYFTALATPRCVGWVVFAGMSKPYLRLRHRGEARTGGAATEEYPVVRLNWLTILTAALAVVVFAALYYTALARQRAALSPAAAAGGRPGPGVLAFELAKSVVLAAVVAGLVSLLGVAGLAGGAKLGLALWVAFPVALLAGSVAHERVPWKLGAIHSGDWLAKLLIISSLVSVWR
jgi:hypothetical protein